MKKEKLSLERITQQRQILESLAQKIHRLEGSIQQIKSLLWEGFGLNSIKAARKLIEDWHKDLAVMTQKAESLLEEFRVKYQEFSHEE